MAQHTSNLVEIDLAKLQLDTENYRLGPQTGQFETIQAMIAEQGEKLVDLAKDIVDIGLSPIDLITVCPAVDPDRYRVVEGNRRITALKLLNEPSLAVGTSIEKPIRKLAIENATRIARKVDCRLLPSKQEAFVWIQRRHDTGLGGAAMIPWNAMSVRRAKEAMGNRQSALEVIDFVMQSGALPEAEKKKVGNIPVTNLERILEDPRAMSRLGIEIRSGDVICSRSKS